MRAWTLLVAFCLVTAGCLGPTGEDDGADTDADDPAADDAQTLFSSERYEGEVTGATVPGGGSVSQGGGGQASFSVPNGTRIAYLNVTTEGGELDMQYGPDCQTDPTISCSNNASTSDGELSVALDTPQPGSWDAFFFVAEDTVAGQVNWTLEVTVGVVTAQPR